MEMARAAVFISSRIILAFLSMFVNVLYGYVNDDNNITEIISINESQYCFVNQNTIRVSDNFTTELLDVINKTEHVVVSTTINSTVIFIAPSNGAMCGSERNFVPEGLFMILRMILVTTILVAVANISLHLMFKKLRTMAGVLVIILCGIVIVAVSISLIYNIINDGSENPTACKVLTSILSYFTLLYQAIKLVILFQFADLMYKSYKLQSQDTTDKRRLLIKFVIFVLVSSILCFLSAILIDLAVTDSKKDSLCLTRQFDFDNLSVFRIVFNVQIVLFIIAQIIVFLIGFTLYYVVNKSCCKTISTSFRIAIALVTTIGVGTILFIILNGIEVSTYYTFLAVGGGTLLEQVFLFILFASSSKVCNDVRKIFIKKKKSSVKTFTIQPREPMEERHLGVIYKELHMPLVDV